MDGGYQGLLTERQSSDRVKQKYNLQNTVVIWVSDIESNIEHIKPQNIEQLSFTTEKFVKNNQKPVVFLGSIEYLMSYNSFNKIFHMISNIKDYISLYQGILLVVMKENILSPQEQSLLSQELRMVEKL